MPPSLSHHSNRRHASEFGMVAWCLIGTSEEFVGHTIDVDRQFFRTLSMTFGRPSSIPDYYVRIELPSKRDFEKSSAFVDDETSYLSVSYFNSTM